MNSIFAENLADLEAASAVFKVANAPIISRRATVRDELVAIINEARCLSKRIVSNDELSDRIMHQFKVTRRERQECGCFVEQVTK